jgi:hypothetical protein
LFLAIQVIEIAAPLISQGVQAYRDRRARDFYPALHSIGWWADKGVMVSVRAGYDDSSSTVTDPKVLEGGAIRRIWADLPSERRVDESKLPEVARTARPLDWLHVVDPAAWPHAELDWDEFRTWASTHVNTFDDYASELIDLPDPPLRRAADGSHWLIRTGSLDADRHVEEQWAGAAGLTTIMAAAGARAVAAAEAEIAAEWARRNDPERSFPSIGPADAPPRPVEAGERSGRPTARARFRGEPGPVFSAWGSRELFEFRFSDPHPTFLVYGRYPAPEGFVLVGGGDYQTYADIRVNTTWEVDVNENVKIQRDWARPGEAIPRAPDRSPLEQQAFDAWRAGAVSGRAVMLEYGPSDQTYRGEVQFPYEAPNTWGRVLVRREDIVTF